MDDNDIEVIDKEDDKYIKFDSNQLGPDDIQKIS